MARARAFLARPDQGVTYGADVWHHPSTVFDSEADFAIMMWQDGSAADDEFVAVAPFEVHAPEAADAL
jgi:ureidoglycolate lyase